MPRQTTVVTPENIPITLELAGIATRFGAWLVDLLIQVCVLAILAIVVGILAAIFSSTFNGLGASIWAALGIIAAFIFFFGYFIFFESIWNGQTPGKRAFKIRVVRDGGYPINFYNAAIRNLIRMADFLPLYYAAGAGTMFFQKQYKRLGDMAAGTLVIREQDSRPLTVVTQTPQSVAAAGGKLPESVKNPLDVLTPEELELLQRYAIRRWEMTSDDSERLAYRLVVPLIPRLNISFLPGVAPRYADLVSVLVAAADAKAEERERQLRGM